MNNDLWGYATPIETDSVSCELNSNIGSLDTAKAVSMRGFNNAVFGGYPAPHPIPETRPALDADEITRDYETRRVHVDKRTHRIRFENESENEVTVVIEPK